MVILSYQLGIAVYLQSDAGISKGQAAAWFQNVEEADMEELDWGYTMNGSISGRKEQ